MPRNADDHPLSLKVCFPFLKAIAWILFGFFGAPIRSKNRSHVKLTGPLLVISNHQSNCDPVVVQYSSPRLIHFLARKELLEMPFVRHFTRWFRAVPIKQSSPDLGALKKAIALLKEGKAVGIFPEGQLSPDGNLLELFEGTALIVRKSGAPCICLGLQGTNKFMPSPRATPGWSFRAIRANWGETKSFEPSATDAEIMAWIESELRRLSHQPQA